jgi:hypothetical protein
MSDSDELEDYQDLSRAELEFRYGILAAKYREKKRHNRATKQFVQDSEKLMSRHVQRLAASGATTMEPDAPALPVAGGSGQPVQAPAPPNRPLRRDGEHRGSIYRSMRDRRPEMERLAHTQTRANRDRVTCTPIEYVSLSPTGSMY